MNHSRQRDLIFEYLRNTKSHPTADEVYAEVRKNEPYISLGTVYRNLNLLADNRMILRIHTTDGIDHFDADIKEHYHFYCTDCKRVSDLDLKLPVSMKKLIGEANKVTQGSVDGCIVYYYGKCESCRNENLKLSKNEH